MAENVYTAQEESLVSIAKAIRNKTGKGENEKLAFPVGFINAIRGISGGGSLTVLTGSCTFDSSTSLSSINIALESEVEVEKIISFYIYTTNNNFPSNSAGTTYDNGTLLHLSTFYHDSNMRESVVSTIKKTSTNQWYSSYSRETSNPKNTYVILNPSVNEEDKQTISFSDENSYILKGSYNWISLVESK